ncbi:MAG: hypothetical protein RR482_02615, partial [Clostridia bacterium]
VLMIQRTDPQKGLETADVLARRAHFGWNVVRLPRRFTWKPLKQTSILWMEGLAAAGLAACARQYEVGALVLLVELFCLACNFISQNGTKWAPGILAITHTPVKTRRDGRIQSISANLLVPGDMVYVEAGDWIPADMRLVSSNMLLVQETLFSGMQECMEKHADTDACLLHLGCQVRSGQAEGVVVETGMRTRLGQCLARIQSDVPLTISSGLRRAYTGLLWITLGVGMAALVGNMLRHGSAGSMWLVWAGLAISILPAGFPGGFAVFLAQAQYRMACSGVQWRRWSVLTRLGRVRVVCMDREAFLTGEELCVCKVSAPLIAVQPEMFKRQPSWMVLATAVALCNEKDKALTEWTEALGFAKKRLRCQYPCLAQETLADGSRVTVHAEGNGFRMFVCAPPFVLLSRCTHLLMEKEISLSSADRVRAMRTMREIEEETEHALSFATRWSPEAMTAHNAEALTLLGTIGFRHALRPEALRAMEGLKAIGVQPLLLTCAKIPLAKAYGQALGLWTLGDGALDGETLAILSDETLRMVCRNTTVYSNLNGTQKQRLVCAWQAQGASVLFAGRTEEDMEALQSAQVGCGAAVSDFCLARAVSSMYLTVDTPMALVGAVAEGHATRRQASMWSLWMMAIGVGHWLATCLSIVCTGVVALQSIQWLWSTMWMGWLGAYMLTHQTKQEKQFPESLDAAWRSPIWRIWFITQCAMVAIALFASWMIGRRWGEAAGQTLAFGVSCLFQWMQAARALDLQTWRRMRRMHPYVCTAFFCIVLAFLVSGLALPGMRHMLHVVILPASGYGWMAALVLLTLAITEMTFRLLVRKNKNKREM